ncbi:dolichol-phosphate mannosyltransferase subunit 3 [Olea europaea subsp. europaea]|uniref:Dolichol-phosphate mannosyltransferase subunit 3 n=2 Tax=Olea europaea subsp. europaea TaxID=158383 RepID=A0A8S0QXJ3_OLEEU|nr:dolichol-phosphate mannosyltransferase subunit 3 [Olea europaea subsp. europaea]
MFGTLRKGFEFHLGTEIINIRIPSDGSRIDHELEASMIHVPFVNASVFCIRPWNDEMKHIVKIMALLVALSAIWISLLQISVIPDSYTWLLPLYSIITLGCYGLFMVGIGLMQFPTCPQEAILLQQDIIEAKDFLKTKGVDVGSD